MIEQISSQLLSSLAYFLERDGNGSKTHTHLFLYLMTFKDWTIFWGQLLGQFLSKLLGSAQSSFGSISNFPKRGPNLSRVRHTSCGTGLQHHWLRIHILNLRMNAAEALLWAGRSFNIALFPGHV